MKDSQLICKFNGIDQRFNEMDRHFERIEERLDTMATRDEMLTRMDAILRIAIRLEQEIKFMNPRFERIERHVGLSPT